MTIKFEIISAERPVYSDDVDVVIAPGSLGELAVLPHHAPLLTALEPGELRIRKGQEETSIAVFGGFLEVLRDKVVVLADVAERADEIDVERAEAARNRAEEKLKVRAPDVDVAQAEAALRRSLIRLRVAEKRRKRQQLT